MHNYRVRYNETLKYCYIRLFVPLSLQIDEAIIAPAINANFLVYEQLRLKNYGIKSQLSSLSKKYLIDIVVSIIQFVEGLFALSHTTCFE